MGLLIKSTQNKPIQISGTNILLNEVYMRIEFAARANGRTLEIVPTTYSSRETYLENKPLYTDIHTSNYIVDISNTESQSIGAALNYTKGIYEQLGYEVIIIT